ncbi:hypothetical protein Tco_0619590 [Tanacetum coccineum]
MLGDMNLIRSPNEHSTMCSFMSSNDFKKCIHNVELEDIASSGLFFTWTKNLFKVKAGNNSGILKKLDKIMGSEEFIDKFGPAHFVFLSYLIPKSIHVIENHGKMILKDAICLRLLKKLKGLKRTLKKITWKDADIFEKVKKLRGMLKDVQLKIDKDPAQKHLREEEV